MERKGPVITVIIERDLFSTRYLIFTGDNRVRVTEVCQQDAVSGGDRLHRGDPV